MYEYTDGVIALLHRKSRRAFSDFAAVLPVDELNLLNGAKKLYKRLAKLSVLWYNDIAEYYFAFFGGKASFWRDDFVTDLLEETDPVAKYRFLSEARRKADRLAESLLSPAADRQKELQQAKRLWLLQTAHFADAVSDAAQLAAYKSRGVQYVQWITKLDGKECKVCRSRHGKVYPIDRLPPKPHYNCRCTVKEVRSGNDETTA